MSKKPAPKQSGDPDTTGHVWDEDLQEFNNPLPRWWLWIFYATIVWGIGYTIAYPAWPMINRATAGVMGFSTRAEVAEDIAAVDAANAAINEKLASVELVAIAADPELENYAKNAGEAVFNTWCVQCHGRGAAGVQASGYPNLLDDDWLWGGDIAAIHETITHGIRNEDSDLARWSEMPAFGRDELLSEGEIASVANYVLQMSGQTPLDASLLAEGEQVYLDQCSACHMEDGTGDRYQGAPNLADAIWLYGGDYETIVDTIYNARFGVMPAWSDRLSEAELRAVATYVHTRGGGEAAPE